jgi:crotonobetainyl-CoA:carnitine CoA-transferase CaiB-like acyl-CoA transferase
MLDVAMILMASHVTGYLRNGQHPKPSGNRMPHATSMAYQTADGIVMIGASNLRQQKRLWTALERLDMIKRRNDERDADREHEEQTLAQIMLTRPAAEWETWLQDRHVPASRVRTMGEALEDPQIAARTVLHRHESIPGIEGSVTVPTTAFRFDHDGPAIDRPPPRFGEHNDEILVELGYTKAQIAGFRASGTI